MTKKDKAKARAKASGRKLLPKIAPRRKRRPKERDKNAISQNHALEALVIIQRAKTANTQILEIYRHRYAKLFGNSDFSPRNVYPELPTSLNLSS